MEMTFQIIIVLTTFSCALVAGLLFTFAVVVMPGFRDLRDRDFIRAFQVVDEVIQNNQPLFMLVWVGSIPLMLASALGGLWLLGLWWKLLLLLSALLYFVGVQYPTITRNLPLNSRIQSVDVEVIDDERAHKFRRVFEREWNYWNRLRASISCAVVMMLLIVLLGQ